MYIRPLALVALCLSLIGCGGGGGSSAPVTPPPAAPTGVIATAGDGYVLIDGNSVAGATGYNIYWSNTPGVTIATGNKLAVSATPQAHTALTNGTPYYYIVTAVGAGGESAASAQVSATPAAINTGNDPLFADQWNLLNTSQPSAIGTLAKGGEDINVQPVWNAGIKGAGVRIAIVDDGLEMAHEDLASNLAANGQSFNYATGSSDPTNDAADTASGHGTAVAGIAAARDLNGLGGRGVAPRATLVGYNLILNPTTSNEVDAMTRNAANVGVSSNSWGAPDGTGELAASGFSWQNAINTGLAQGRGGKGTVYVWAAGNGAASIYSDNSNYDGQANYRGVMAVGAVNDQGLQSKYSESGANLWVVAPGGELCDTHTITTTDRTGSLGFNSASTANDYPNKNYTKCMNGTSSATPTVSGVVALMLEANPSLSWRDVRIILAQSARVNDAGVCQTVPVAPNPCPASNTGWFLNGIGASTTTNPRYYFNHKYGFGVVDAKAAVAMAKTWGLPVAELTYSTALSSPALVIPDAPQSAAIPNNGVSNIITVPTTTGITSIEWVEITFTAAHPFTGDLDITLTSPSGSVSQLAVPHSCAGANGACSQTYSGWVFGSAAHLGEVVNGNWTLRVKDATNDNLRTLPPPPIPPQIFNSWKLKFYGH